MNKKILFFCLIFIKTSSYSDKPSTKLYNTDEAWLVEPYESKYGKKEIFKKIKKYQWPREKILTFLILQKLHNLKISDWFDYTFYHGKNSYKHGNIYFFTKKFNNAVSSLKMITNNAFFDNNWDYTANPAFSYVKELEVSVTKYVKNNSMKKLFEKYKVKKKPESYEETIFYQLSNCSDNEWINFEYDLLSYRRSREDLKLHDYFYLERYFKELEVYRNLLFVVYNDLYKFVPRVTFFDVIFFDWPKFLLSSVIDSVYKSNKVLYSDVTLRKEWEGYTGKDLKYFFSTISDISSDIHSMLTEYHLSSSSYIPKSTSPSKNKMIYCSSGTTSCNCSSSSCSHTTRTALCKHTRCDMKESALQTSFIGLGARKLLNMIIVSPDDAKMFKYVTIGQASLKKYTSNDRKILVKLITTILQLRCKDTLYISEVIKMYQKYL